MKKKMFLVLFVLLLTGCTNQYNINFSNDKIEEEIVSNILIQDIPVQSAAEIAAGIELDDSVTPYIEDDQYPFIDDTEKKYEKTVNKGTTSTQVKLNYTYSHDEYRNSRVFKTCFKNKELTETRNYYNLSFSGDFYCLYGDEIEVNIRTDNEVLYNNADKVNGNVYTWIINRDNKNKANISMQISKKSAKVNSIFMVIIGIVGVILVIGGFIAYKNLKNHEAVNEI